MMAFLQACSDGDLVEMKRRAPSLDLYENNEDGETAMWLACANGHLDAANLLIELYPDDVRHVCAWSRNYHNESPMWIACANGHLKVAQWLHANGGDVNVLNSKLESPLWAACANGHLGVVQWLFSVQSIYRDTICVCAASRHLEVVKWLVGENMPIVGHGWSAMVAACEGGNLDVVKWLYMNGASLTDMTDDSSTPMWAACTNGHLDIAKWIYSVEMVDLATVNFDGFTYMMAACYAGHLETAKWLYSVGTSVHAVNYFEETALTLACEYGDLPVVEWLYQRGLGVRTPNAIGQTPLMLACIVGNLKLVRWLFHHGAHLDIHLPDDRGNTPLGQACIVGALDVAQWLHAQGAELDKGVTTSFYVAEKKHWEVVFWLHEKGARLIPNLLAYADPALACRMVIEGLASTDAHVDKWKVHYLRDPDAVRDLLLPRLKDTFEIYRVMNTVPLPVWCLVAEFAGVLRGRPLRNVREAIAILEDGENSR